MSYDFFAQHPIRNQRDVQKLSGDLAPYARIILFAQTLLSSDKEGVRGNEYKNELSKLGKGATLSLLADLNLDTPQEINLSLLPLGSFFISFKFKLARPYISRDDEPFYIIDNPLAKEKVFKIPIVRPSSWKGTLRAAIRLVKVWDDNHPDLLSLFGIASGDQPDDGKRGRLHFYPTFFDDIDREVINPHDRETKAGRQPIYFECAPIGATATFTLLYIPFDCIGENARETRRQVAADLQLVTEGLRAMFTLYGFGAKTSSGFGLAADSLRDGRLQVAGLDAPGEAPPDTAVARPAPALPRYLSAPGRLHPDFRAADGSLISEAEYQQKIERRGQKYAKKDKQLYNKAKGWWEREGKVLAEQAAPEPKPPERPEPARPPVAVRTFTNWDELQDKAAELARLLAGGDA